MSKSTTAAPAVADVLDVVAPMISQGAQHLADITDQRMVNIVKANERQSVKIGTVTALAVAVLVDVRNNTGAEVIERTGLSANHANTSLSIGRVLLAVAPEGEEAVRQAFAQVRDLKSGQRGTAWQSLLSQEVGQRGAFLTSHVVSLAVVSRLGGAEKAKAEDVDVLVKNVLAEGAVREDTAGRVIAAVADRVGITLPKVERPTAPGKAAGGSLPTLAEAIASLRAVIVAATTTGDPAPHLTDADLASVESLADDLIALAASEHEVRRTVAVAV